MISNQGIDICVGHCHPFACMLAAKACIHVAHVFHKLIFNLHDIQLALHKKDRNKGVRIFSLKPSRDDADQVAVWKTNWQKKV